MEEPREPSRGLNQEERLEMLIENFSKDDSFPTEVFDEDLLIPPQLEELARKVCEPLSAVRPFREDDVSFADTTNETASVRDLKEIDVCTSSEDKQDKSHSQEVTFEEHSNPAKELLIEEVCESLEVKEESSSIVDPSSDVSLAARSTGDLVPTLGTESSGIIEKTDQSCLVAQDDVSNKEEELLRDTNEETSNGDKSNLIEESSPEGSHVHLPLQVCEHKVEDLERSEQSTEAEEVNVSIQQEIFVKNDVVLQEQECLQQKEPTQEMTRVLLSDEPCSSVTGAAQSKEEVLPIGAANSINETEVDDKTCNLSVPTNASETHERKETKEAQKDVRVESNVPLTQESAQYQYEALHRIDKPEEAVALAVTESSDASQQSQMSASKVEIEQEVTEVEVEAITSTKELSEISPRVSIEQQAKVAQKLDEVALETFESSSVEAIALVDKTSDVAQQVDNPQAVDVQEVSEGLCEASNSSSVEAIISPGVGTEQQVKVNQDSDEVARETFESTSVEAIALTDKTSDVAQQVDAHPQILVAKEVIFKSVFQEVNEDVCEVFDSSSADATTSTKEPSEVSPPASDAKPKLEVESFNDVAAESFESSTVEFTDPTVEPSKDVQQDINEPQVEVVQDKHEELPENKVQDGQHSMNVTNVESVDVQMESKTEVVTETGPEELPTTSGSFNETTSSSRKKKKNQRVQQPTREPHKDSSVGSQGNKENLPLQTDSNQTGGRSKKNKSKNKNAKAVASPTVKEKLSSQATASPSIGSAASDEEDNEKVLQLLSFPE